MNNQTSKANEAAKFREIGVRRFYQYAASQVCKEALDATGARKADTIELLTTRINQYTPSDTSVPNFIQAVHLPVGHLHKEAFVIQQRDDDWFRSMSSTTTATTLKNTSYTNLDNLNEAIGMMMSDHPNYAGYLLGSFNHALLDELVRWEQTQGIEDWYKALATAARNWGLDPDIIRTIAFDHMRLYLGQMYPSPAHAEERLDWSVRQQKTVNLALQINGQHAALSEGYSEPFSTHSGVMGMPPTAIEVNLFQAAHMLLETYKPDAEQLPGNGLLDERYRQTMAMLATRDQGTDHIRVQLGRERSAAMPEFQC